jgi:hypothetical protein
VSEQPGRYQRSFSGMVGALVILLLGIGAFIVFRAVTRDELEVEAETVDYLEVVGFVQEADRTVLYPPTLPDGWRATSVEADRPDAWGIGFLTPEGFAGLQQSEDSTDDLVETYVDEEPEELDPVRIDGTTWEVWRDDAGDLGYAGEVDGLPVLVFGSAGAPALEGLAASLTSAPLPG